MDVRHDSNHLQTTPDSHKGDFTTRTYGGYLWSVPNVTDLKLGSELGYLTSMNNEFMLREQHWLYKEYAIDLLGVMHYNIAHSKFNLIGCVFLRTRSVIPVKPDQLFL
jgi:hypothetical protein